MRRSLNMPLYKAFYALVFITSIAVTGCSGGNPDLGGEAKYPSGYDRSTTGENIYGKKESIFGKDGLSWGKGGDKKNDGSTGIGVNSFLWRASLDTVSFMPLASADPFGGVIITDWYSPEENPNERFKINVFILDKQLRSDGIKVKIFRQTNQSGRWLDSNVADNTGPQMEEAILTRARQLRVAQLAEE